MSKQFRVSLDPLFLKPVIEAMIFASEEPLSGRALIRLLAGDRETQSDDGAAVQEAEASGADVDAPADEAVDGDDAVAEQDAAEEDAAEEDADAVSIDASTAHATRIDRGGEEGEEVAAANGDFSAADASAADTSGAEDGSEAEAMPQDGLTGSPRELADAVERAEARKASKRAASTGLDVLTVRTLVAELNEEYEITGRAFRIVEVAGGYQFATTRDYGEFVALMAKEKLRRRLSPAALETLAIIAYRQPVSKPEVEAIRGVNCDQVLVNLMEKNLVVITGRSEGVGRPLLYGTTEDFLRSFGLKGIGDLPKLREIEELMEEGTYSAEKAEVITVDANTGAEEIEARVGAAGHTEHSEAEGSEAGESDADNQHGSIELVPEDGDANPTADADGSRAAEIDDEPDDAEGAEEIDDVEDDGDEEDEEEIEDEDDEDEELDEDDGPYDADGDEEIEDESDEEIDSDDDEDLDDEPADDGGDEEAADRASGVGAADEPVMAEPGEADE